jgi:fumarate hydratase class I
MPDKIPKFEFEPMFVISEDSTTYKKLTDQYISSATFNGRELLMIETEGISLLTEQAFKDMAHLYRSSHLEKLTRILDDSESSPNDRFVALAMLKNAVISAEGEFPMCQDTGTAIIYGRKGERVFTTGNDEEAVSKGVFNAYVKNNLRYSQRTPLTMYKAHNSGSNLPAQIELHACSGNEYRYLMIAKGGGSANKTSLYKETRAIFEGDKLVNFLMAKMKNLGTTACPPYHLAFVIGGTSADANLKAVKLASARYLDGLPHSGYSRGHAFRDVELEIELLQRSRKLGIGAQFGGKYFCHDVRVIRLPRHGASCFVGAGVSCSADRNIKAKITREGIFLEELESNPSRYLPETSEKDFDAISIDLDQPMEEICKILSKYQVSTPLRLTGKIIVARDIAHANLKERLLKGDGLPDYFKNHIIYYAGPSKTPHGYPSGSFGPTTAGRMDEYVPLFQSHGASLIMLAKGNRSPQVTESCKRHGGFYLGSIGGPAALLGKECITKMKTIEYPELGMEAIYEITVKDFPAFILIDDKGNDFFQNLI